MRVIFRQLPKDASTLHCGSRIVVAGDGRLFVGLGERFSRKDDAQTLDNHLGKVVRIDPEGKPIADNPFAATAGALSEIWSRGHRNIQGMAMHPGTAELWASEHGPQGGDEINVVEGGRNYGWPLVTYGRNYGTGTRIGEEGPKPGFEQSLKWWVPSNSNAGAKLADMNWEQLQAIFWLRWRLTKNGFGRAGPVNAMIAIFMAGLVLTSAMILSVGGFLAGGSPCGMPPRRSCFWSGTACSSRSWLSGSAG